MKGAAVFKRVILFRLLHSADGNNSLFFVGALVVLSCGRLVTAEVLHQGLHLIPNLRRLLSLMLLWIIEVAATTAKKLAASFLKLEVFLGSCSDRAMLGGMMVELHSHALELASFL